MISMAYGRRREIVRFALRNQSVVRLNDINGLLGWKRNRSFRLSKSFHLSGILARGRRSRRRTASRIQRFGPACKEFGKSGRNKLHKSAVKALKSLARVTLCAASSESVWLSSPRTEPFLGPANQAGLRWKFDELFKRVGHPAASRSRTRVLISSRPITTVGTDKILIKRNNIEIEGGLCCVAIMPHGAGNDASVSVYEENLLCPNLEKLW
jgi:hypothetical protein